VIVEPQIPGTAVEPARVSDASIGVFLEHGNVNCLSQNHVICCAINPCCGRTRGSDTQVSAAIRARVLCTVHYKPINLEDEKKKIKKKLLKAASSLCKIISTKSHSNQEPSTGFLYQWTNANSNCSRKSRRLLAYSSLYHFAIPL